jgi:hypothetical protein
MMAGPIAPILLIGGLQYANNWYTSNGAKATDLKPLVAAGIAAAVGSALARVPGADSTVTGVAWIALVAWLVVNAGQKGSVVDSLTKLVGGL